MPGLCATSGRWFVVRAVDACDDRVDVGALLYRLQHRLAVADVVGVGLVGPDVLGPRVLVERVSDGEVAVRKDGATDRTLVALVVGRLMDEQVLRCVGLQPAPLDSTRPHGGRVDGPQ